MNFCEQNTGDIQNLLLKSYLCIPRPRLMRVIKVIRIHPFVSVSLDFLHLGTPLIFVEVTLCFDGTAWWKILDKYSSVNINITLNISTVYIGMQTIEMLNVIFI